MLLSIRVRADFLQARAQLGWNLLGHGVVDQADADHVGDVNLIDSAKRDELEDEQFAQLDGVDALWGLEERREFFA